MSHKETTINAYAVNNPGDNFQPFSYTLGALSPNEVELEVLYCGICHSDVSMANNEWGMTEYPFVGGHEVIGRVVARGELVEHVAIGSVVGLGWHCGYCHNCDSCESGDLNLCANAEGTIVGHHGGFADKVRAKASSVVLIPLGIDLKSAGPMLCGGITVYNPMKQFEVKPTDKVAVIGIGGLGHIALKLLSAWGCEVTAFTSSDSKREAAVAMGADKTLNSCDVDAITAAAGSFDYIITTVNVSLDWNLYLNTLKPKGRLHFVGAVLEPLNIGAFSLIMGQRSISGSPVGAPNTIKEMFEFSKLHAIQPEVELFPMSEINEAMEHLKSGKAKYRIVLTNEA